MTTTPEPPDAPLVDRDLAQRVADWIMDIVPADGSPIGNAALRRTLQDCMAPLGLTLTDGLYWHVHGELVRQGRLLKGQGRGGSVRRSLGGAVAARSPTPAAAEPAALTLQPAPSAPVASAAPASPSRPRAATAGAAAAPAAADGVAAPILAYRHPDRRVNNPEVGMVTPRTDPPAPRKRWAYDPHLDPALQFDVGRAQIERLIDDALASGDPEAMRAALEELKRLQAPYLNWTGKAERTSFEVDTVSLHVHERMDPLSILSAVRKAMKGEGPSQGRERALQPDLFAAPFENLPLRDAIDFYRHERGWANRLIAGDSLLVMNSLLQKEGMAGRVQMIYLDPPYGIKYGSNFQPFVNKRDVKDRNDEDLTQEPEQIRAFRDTWELGIHSYLTYLRDRLLLARELLSETGSVFVQISDENLHHVREIMDEVFGAGNFAALVTFKKTGGQTSQLLAPVSDYIVHYAKDIGKVKYRQLFLPNKIGEGRGSGERYTNVIDERGRIISAAEASDKTKHIRIDPITSNRTAKEHEKFHFEFCGVKYLPAAGRTWSTTSEGLFRLARAGRIYSTGNQLCYVRYFDDFPAIPINNFWDDSAGKTDKVYVVQTFERIIERCLLMTTDPGDLVFDPTCGSGTTAYVAEKWGRRWITCDTSRVAVTLAKQRLLTASFDYYALKYPHEGLKGGFIWKTVPHVTLKSIANNPEIDEIYARMHPAIEQALAGLNAALRATPPAPFAITEGGRKGRKVDFALPADRTETLPSGEVVMAGALLEWEVPFDFPDGWPDGARAPFEAFHAARRAMQKAMDASIAAHAEQEVLYDQPAVDKSRLRVTGPFTVEAVPFASVKSLDEPLGPAQADASIARTGESGRQHQWREELVKTGIRGRNGQVLRFADLEALPYDASVRHLHATGHLESGERVVVSFGPEHAALEQRQVALALTEAEKLRPQPAFVVFCAFAFDPEAAKDIDETRWPGVTLLKAQMNPDLLTEDLKKARASNQSFWLVGQPEVEVRRRKDGLYEVEVHGFDYFDTVRGELVSGGKGKIALWLLDTDYDERSLFPRQVFFPMAGKGEGWERLKKSIRAELDETRLAAFHGTVSLPFAAGGNRKIAVKITDDRGIESLKVIPLSE